MQVLKAAFQFLKPRRNLLAIGPHVAENFLRGRRSLAPVLLARIAWRHDSPFLNPYQAKLDESLAHVKLDSRGGIIIMCWNFGR